MATDDLATALFEAQRPRLLRLGYRMLGSLSEAEDIVQSAWLRWRRADIATITMPQAFLSRIVTRLCLDQIKSARNRRETYIGPWIPEPLVETGAEEDGDDLTLTLMMALERLSPLERAAFLLHDVFGLPLDEVAATLKREAPAVRQLAVRARAHVRDARPRYPVARDEGERIAQAFFAASREGDVAALGAMLAEQVTIHSDGGGRVFAFPNPIVGIARVLRLFEGLARKYGEDAFTMVEPMWIDGLPGFASLEHGRLLQITALEIEDGRIATIYVTRNPDKLAHVARALAVDVGTASR